MANQDKKGIWSCARDLPAIDEKYQFSLGEGSTPCEIKDNIYFKLEYKNPTGSVKDRGISYQMSFLASIGVENAVISSSGNAAISASNYSALYGIDLTVFVSTHIHSKKLEALKKLNNTLIQSARPKSDAAKYAQLKNIYNLRQSTDPQGKIGYMTLGFEIAEMDGIDGIFMPVSSGTTLAGLYEGLSQKEKSIPLHSVQTANIHPVAGQFDKEFILENTSVADALVARSTPRLEEVSEYIQKTGGFGWVISNDMIRLAHSWLESHNLHCSYEGAVALAGLWKARKKGYYFKNPLILLTGVSYE